MGIVRSFLILMGVFLACITLLGPFSILDVPAGSEVWLYQSITELSRSLHLAPTLNGFSFTGPNPPVATLLSLLPFPDLFTLRIVGILLGCLVALSVLIFCASLWDIKTGVYSALLTMTSWGFIAKYGLISAAAIPATLTVLAFLLFSQVYLKGFNSGWYVLSYLLMCLAFALGGWLPLLFFIFAVVFLILLDMSPKSFLSIRLGYSALFIGGVIVLVYSAYWIFESFAYAKSLYSYTEGRSLTGRLGLWATYNLPWLALVIPAWMYAEGPQSADTWRSLLVPKTGYAVGLAAVVLSGHFQEGYVLLGIPFGCILMGYWMARGMLIRQGLKIVRTLCMAFTAAAVAVSAVVFLSLGPLMTLSLDLGKAATAAVFLLLAGMLAWFTRRQSYALTVGLCMVSVVALSWYAALVLLPLRAKTPISFVSRATSYSPLLVFQDDLVMRGYTGYAGARPTVVGKKMVPVGTASYLAVSTDDLDALQKNLAERMHVQVISSLKQHKTYALLKVSPPVPRRQAANG